MFHIATSVIRCCLSGRADRFGNLAKAPVKLLLGCCVGECCAAATELISSDDRTTTNVNSGIAMRRHRCLAESDKQDDNLMRAFDLFSGGDRI